MYKRQDINQPRQSFICIKQRDEAVRHLTDNTWALVGHENAATLDPQECIYSESIKQEFPRLEMCIRDRDIDQLCRNLVIVAKYRVAAAKTFHDNLLGLLQNHLSRFRRIPDDRFVVNRQVGVCKLSLIHISPMEAMKGN